jgi:hypothetical protein
VSEGQPEQLGIVEGDPKMAGELRDGASFLLVE